MPKKISEEQRVLEYFDTAMLAKAEVVLELVKIRVKARQKQEAGPLTQVRFALRKPKVNGAPKATSFEHPKEVTEEDSA